MSQWQVFLLPRDAVVRQVYALQLAEGFERLGREAAGHTIAWHRQLLHATLSAVRGLCNASHASKWQQTSMHVKTMDSPGAHIPVDVAKVGVGAIVVICEGGILLLQCSARRLVLVAAFQQNLQEQLDESKCLELAVKLEKIREQTCPTMTCSIGFSSRSFVTYTKRM